MSGKQNTTRTNSALTRPTTAASPLASRPFGGSPSHGGGQSLDKHTQAEMSAKFGHDFSQVRIHTDALAAQSAQSVGANAYALGSDIVFGQGKFQPGSPDTERLLAHELTHVVQQDLWGVGDWGRASRKGDASEREADSLASQVMMGRSVQVQAAPQAAVARNADDGTEGSSDAVSASETPQQSSDTSLASDTWNVATNNAVSGVTATAQEAAKDASNSGAEAGFGAVNSVLAPLGVVSNAQSMTDDLSKGNFVDGAVDGVALGSSMIGTVGVAGSLLTAAGAGGAGAALSEAVATGGGTALGVAGGGSILGTLGAAGGAFAGGYVGGKLLAEHTELGQDSADQVQAIDQIMSDGKGAGPNNSTLVQMDDYRKEAWQKGGLGNDAAAIGVGIAEGGVGLAGALAGVGEGIFHAGRSLLYGPQGGGAAAPTADQGAGGASGSPQEDGVY